MVLHRRLDERCEAALVALELRVLTRVPCMRAGTARADTEGDTEGETEGAGESEKT